MREPIVQEHNYACGAACMAFVAGIPCGDALNLMGTAKATMGGYHGWDISTALRFLGMPYVWVRIKPDTRDKVYQEGAIVFIARSKRYLAGHYLAYHRGKWMDPWMNMNEDPRVENARAGFRDELPGRVLYALLPEWS